MSWQTEMGEIVRYLVNDFTAPYTYTSGQITKAITIGAQLTQTEVEFDYDYTIDVPNSGISPDPTLESSPRDDGFINLVSLKTSMVILGNELKVQSTRSIRVVDGPSSIDTSNNFNAMNSLYKQRAEEYEHAKAQYFLGGGRTGKAVFGPITVPFLPSY